MPAHNIWQNFVIVIIFHVFVIDFYIPMSHVIYSSFDSFSTINDLSMSVNNSNVILVFFRVAFHANPVLKNNMQDQVHIFLCSFCRIFWMCLLDNSTSPLWLSPSVSNSCQKYFAHVVWIRDVVWIYFLSDKDVSLNLSQQSM